MHLWEEKVSPGPQTGRMQLHDEKSLPGAGGRSCTVSRAADDGQHSLMDGQVLLLLWARHESPVHAYRMGAGVDVDDGDGGLADVGAGFGVGTGDSVGPAGAVGSEGSGVDVGPGTPPGLAGADASSPTSTFFFFFLLGSGSESVSPDSPRSAASRVDGAR